MINFTSPLSLPLLSKTLGAVNVVVFAPTDQFSLPPPSSSSSSFSTGTSSTLPRACQLDPPSLEINIPADVVFGRIVLVAGVSDSPFCFTRQCAFLEDVNDSRFDCKTELSLQNGRIKVFSSSAFSNATAGLAIFFGTKFSS